MIRKVYFVTEHVGDTLNAGGLRSYYSLATVNSSGAKVTVFASNISCEINEEIQIIELRPRDSNNLNKYIRAFLQLYSAIRVLMYAVMSRKGTHFILTCPSYLSTLIIGLYCTLAKKRYIVDIRDLYPDVLVSVGIIGQHSLFHRVVSCLTKYVLKKSEHIICVTEGIRQKLISSYGVDPASLTLVYNGFPERLLTSREVQKYNKFTLVCFGRMGLFQDAKILSNIIQTSLDMGFNFILISSGPQFNNLVSMFEKFESFQHFGLMQRDVLWSIVSKCHVNVSIRADEEISHGAFPVRVWEGFGLGLPCLNFPPAGETGHFIQTHQVGWNLKRSDHNEIKRCLRDIWRDYRSARNRIDLKLVSEYSREKQMHKIDDVIKEFLYG